MRREIYEQPAAIAKTVEKHLKDDIIFPGELHTCLLYTSRCV